MAERLAVNQDVVGSNPSIPDKNFLKKFFHLVDYFYLICYYNSVIKINHLLTETEQNLPMERENNYDDK